MNSIGNHQIDGDRELQEDYFATYQQGDIQVAVVTDGMGGHASGDHASELALKAFTETLRQRASDTDIPGDLRAGVEAATRALARYQAGHPESADMGTTLVALLLRGGKAWWISVGDSLMYLWRDGRLQRLNVAHTHGKQLLREVTQGRMTKEQAKADPDFDALSSAITGAPPPEIDCPIRGMEVREGDLFLLASDGLETLTEQEISRFMAAPKASPQQIAEQLIHRVESKHEPEQDNCTVVTLRIEPPRKSGRRSYLALALLLTILLGAITGWLAYRHFYPETETVEKLPAKEKPAVTPAAKSEATPAGEPRQTDTIKPEAPEAAAPNVPDAAQPPPAKPVVPALPATPGTPTAPSQVTPQRQKQQPPATQVKPQDTMPVPSTTPVTPQANGVNELRRSGLAPLTRPTGLVVQQSDKNQAMNNPRD